MTAPRRPTIIKRKRNREYTVAPNQLVNDERLSADALGVLVYIISKPQGWQVITEQLMKRFNVGKDKIHRILRELREARYSTKEFERDDGGRIVGQYMVFYDEPQPDEDPDQPAREESAPAIADNGIHRNPGFPAAEKPAPVNPAPVVKKDIYKPSPQSPPGDTANAEHDPGGASGAKGQEIGTRADSFFQSTEGPPLAESTAGGREGHDGEALPAIRADDRTTARADFEELKIFWRPYNSRCLDDAWPRFWELSIEERAQAISRARQYIAAKQHERKTSRKPNARPRYCTLAEWCGDKIFKHFGPPVKSAEISQARPARLNADDALSDEMALRAATEGWIVVFYEFVNRKGRLPDEGEIQRERNFRAAWIREKEELAREPAKAGHSVAVTVLKAGRAREEMLTKKTLRLHGQHVPETSQTHQELTERLI